MPQPSGRSVAGGAHYHKILHATETWKRFIASEQSHATHTAVERARNDERRGDADLSAHAPA